MMVKVSGDRKLLAELAELESERLMEEVNHILGKKAVLATEISSMNDEK